MSMFIRVCNAFVDFLKILGNKLGVNGNMELDKNGSINSMDITDFLDKI